ncbi:MAG: hypothetical protein K0Q55_3113 [Verrucomicrobia bacterium]|jgi:hypothetical protein|nr:hypothetical protein [Verrucomicrobiota bacterium]
MARLIPELTATQLSEFRSRAEARVYEACRELLPDDIVVLHSIGWVYRDGSGKLREGEADFTLLLPDFGVVALEVKGGGVSFDARTGEWFSVDRTGTRHQIKDPFKQAARERHALNDQITGHPSWRGWRVGQLAVGHAVMLPDISDARTLVGPDRPRDIIGTSMDLADIATWLKRVCKFWRPAVTTKFGAAGVRLVQEVLSSSIEVRPALSAVLHAAEQHRLRLTSNQAKILRIIGGRRRAVVSGGAGTGKTVLAVEKARALAEQGLSVLLLCYNRPLADALALGLREHPGIQVLSFHQLCDLRIRQAHQSAGRNVLTEAEQAYPGHTDRHRFDVQLPYALALTNEVLTQKYDAVVVDEAQDFSDEYWFAIEELMSDDEHGHLFVFTDENQKLYPRHANLPVPDEPFYLTTNCRNTSAIHEAAYAFYRGEPIDAPETRGIDVERVAHSDLSAQAEFIAQKLQRLIVDDQIAPSDLAVLVAKRPKAACYEALGRACASMRPSPKLSIEHHGRVGYVLVDTVARFKGLEAQVVLLWLGDEVVTDGMWETMYVGATRAKTLLIIVGSTLAVGCTQPT